MGLLAYALFKQAVRETVQSGEASVGSTRNPSPTTVKVHRDAAQRLLGELVDHAIESARPDIETFALREAIETGDAAIRAHVDRRTGFWMAVLAGTIAWLLSLVVTIIIIWLSGRGDAVSALLHK